MKRSILIVCYFEFKQHATRFQKKTLLDRLKRNLHLNRKRELRYDSHFGQWSFNKVIWWSDISGRELMEIFDSSKQSLEEFNLRIFRLEQPDEEVHYESGLYKVHSIRALQEAAHA